VTLAYPAFATDASAAEVLAPSQASKCLQWQYHGGSGVEMALRADRQMSAEHAVSRALPPAISRKQAVQILVPIDVPIMSENCQSIASRIGSRNQRSAVAYAPPNVWLDVSLGMGSKPEEAQYQMRRSWYQPRYPKLVSNDNPRRPVAIEAVATKSTQAPRARRDTPKNLRDTRLMIRIGLLLGMGYLLFLTVWFWATRIRPRSTTWLR
jgi:hypothetical protein